MGRRNSKNLLSYLSIILCRYMSLFLPLVFLVSCSSPTLIDSTSPPVSDNPELFDSPYETKTIVLDEYWWHIFADPVLNQLIEESLRDNFSLKQYHARLRQSYAIARKIDAGLYPELSADLSYDKRYNRDRVDQDGLFAGLRLSWELDLWDRLSSGAEAARFDALSSEDELEAAALLLTAEIASTYFKIIERSTQYRLLEKQIQTNNKTLDILRLRFSYGGSSLVDIYQQQEQLVATRAGVPQVSSELTLLQYRLSVLLGKSPSQWFRLADDTLLPDLPPLPGVGVPADLLLRRPDLRIIENDLRSAGYRIDQARADQLPRITIGSRAGLSGTGVRSDDLFLSLISGLVAPIFDAGKRAAEVERTEAVLDEVKARFSQTYLVAIEEVQSALWREKNQLTLILTKKEQLEVARSALFESQKRYLQGVSDYLPVLTALYSTQRLEREIISLQKDLILIRVQLCQAIGSSSSLAEYLL
jgi:NodT family efflux transporter outer membrane factor (OMF) lipoprotein